MSIDPLEPERTKPPGRPKKKTMPQLFDISESQDGILDDIDFHDSNSWRRLMTTMVHSYNFDEEKIRTAFEDALSDYRDMLGMPVKYPKGTEAEQATHGVVRLHAFLMAVYALTQPGVMDGRELSDIITDNDMRRAVSALNSLKNSVKAYKKHADAREKKAADERSRRRANKHDYRTRARVFVDNDYDPASVGDLPDVASVKLLVEMYRVLRERHNRNVGMREKMTEDSYLLRRRYASLVTSYMNLKKKHEGKAAAERWKTMYDERIQRKDEERTALELRRKYNELKSTRGKAYADRWMKLQEKRKK